MKNFHRGSRQNLISTIIISDTKFLKLIISGWFIAVLNNCSASKAYVKIFHCLNKIRVIKIYRFIYFKSFIMELYTSDFFQLVLF